MMQLKDRIAETLRRILGLGGANARRADAESAETPATHEEVVARLQGLAAEPGPAAAGRHELLTLVQEQRACLAKRRKEHTMPALHELLTKRALAIVGAVALFVGAGATIGAASTGNAGGVLGVFNVHEDAVDDGETEDVVDDASDDVDDATDDVDDETDGVDDGEADDVDEGAIDDVDDGEADDVDDSATDDVGDGEVDVVDDGDVDDGDDGEVDDVDGVDDGDVDDGDDAEADDTDDSDVDEVDDGEADDADDGDVDEVDDDETDDADDGAADGADHSEADDVDDDE